jgi:hypothetical protein
VLELARIATVARRMAQAVLSTESAPGKSIASDHTVVEKLGNAMAEFITQLEKEVLTGDVTEQLTNVLQAEQHLLSCAGQALEVTKAQADLEPLADTELAQRISRYRSEVVKLMELANPEAEEFSFSRCEAQLEQVQVLYDVM